MNLDQALQTFVGESRELLDLMEQSLLALGRGEQADEEVHAIFRAAHTIKGSAGLFGLDDVVSFTHVVESLLDQVRDGRLALSDDLVGLLLASRDHIADLIEIVASGTGRLDAETVRAGSDLAARLTAHLIGPMSVADSVKTESDTAATATATAGHWHVSLRFHRDTLRHGMDPLSFLHYLARLGELGHVEVLADAMPDAELMDPEACYLGFEVALLAATDRAAIESVFEFVQDSCQLHILEPGSAPARFLELAESLPEDTARLRDALIACGSLEPEAVSAPATVPDATADTGETAVAASAAGTRPRRSGEARSIRVDADRLDQLIDQIGELIIASAGASLAARQSQDAELQERTLSLASLVQAVRESALQLRMVRIGDTFKRFQRVVHDTSRELGKDIGLVISGEDTELDKTVVEKVADPITHLVRNAMDHGIEPAETRLACGKPARGTITLDAWHDSGSIVIRVADDGGGLDRDRILAKAVERGLVEAGRQLVDGDVYDLIFEPGFSTAEQVTNLSGRGVGMDVVKRNITALRGSIAIDSTPGRGTEISIRLPLTLAIIDGFLVRVGESVFVVPLDVIEECVEFADVGEHDFINLRGEVLPFIRLREVFGVGEAAGRRQSIVVIRHAGRACGLVVDALLGEFQTVIKPLGKVFNGVKCVSGSTVLGDGHVALILDVPALVEREGHGPAIVHSTTGRAPALA